MEKVIVVGAGYVGLCTAATLAEQGHEVTVLDTDASKLSAIREGRAPFYEPGLDELLRTSVASGHLRTASDWADVDPAGSIILCIGTPPHHDGQADLTALRSAATDVGRAITAWPDPPLIITKSTVPPGTMLSVTIPVLETASRSKVGRGFHVASVPEFLREGTALQDARRPDRIVVGTQTSEAAERVWRLYGSADCPHIDVNCPTAELTKYAANTFLAARVALSNEIANVAARHGVDWYDVVRGIADDERIGPLFLRAGAGFGGSCFPKDVAALAAVASGVDVPTPILRAVLANNERQPIVVVDMLKEELGPLDGKRIALLGLSFKPDTDDVRATRALPIYHALLKEGSDVIVHDPRAARQFTLLAPGCVAAPTTEDALRGADGAIIQTEWADYRAIAPATFTSLMTHPVVVDGRRTFDPQTLRAAGVRYRAVGLGPT